MISTLPPALQGSYMKTLKLEKTAHMQAEVKSFKSIVKTLRATKNYLAGATDDEKLTIAKVLYFFEDQDYEHGGDGSAESVRDMVAKMIRDKQNEIKKLQQEILKARAR